MTETHTKIEIIKPLLAVTKFLAISPNYNFAQKKLVQTGRHKFYCVMFSVISTACAVYSFCGRFTLMVMYMSKTRIFIDASNMFLTHFISVLTTLTIIFRKSRRFEAMLSKFAISDDILARYTAGEKQTHSLYYEIAFLFLYAITSLSFGWYLWINIVGFAIFRYYLFENFQRMHVMFLMWVLYKLVLALRRRFRLLNQVLSSVLKDYIITHKGHHVYRTIMGSNFKSMYQGYDWVSDVRTMRRLYTLLSEITDLFNDVFGWIMLLVTLNNVCGFLVAAHMVITFQLKLFATSIAIGFVAFSLTFVAPSLTFGTVLAILCDTCTNEARQTSMLAYDLLHEVNSVSSIHSRRICEDVLLLAQQASTRHPFFTAAGFSKIDHSMLFTMIGIFTSYLLVLIQFIKLYESLPE